MGLAERVTEARRDFVPFGQFRGPRPCKGVSPFRPAAVAGISAPPCSPCFPPPRCPLLRRLDPETAHTLALRALTRAGAPARPAPTTPRWAVTAFGRRFSNPIGLAAGFDKNAAAGPAIMRLGFGFVETGSVTPRPQFGNPRPRIFRLTPDRGIINRLGFNNQGLAVYVRNLARLADRTIPLGANVGINKEGADPIRDYPALIEAVGKHVDYAVINVSSPNTPGLRDLQSEDQLRRILQAVAGNRRPAADPGQNGARPLA